jgi:transglutaminase-like putative cysteine protease
VNANPAPLSWVIRPTARLGRTVASKTAAEGSLALRLAAFAALLTFAGAHWIGFVANPPVGRLPLVTAIATATGLSLIATTAIPGPWPVRAASRALLILAALALAVMAAGLHARLLLPTHWSALTNHVDDGLRGTYTAIWPYDGDDQWLRLTVLLALPVTAIAAAALAFWPVRRGAALLRPAALVLLISMYALAVTERGLGAPIGRGLVLLLLAAAWLWLPRLRVRNAAAAAAAVALAGTLALPVAAGLHERAGWLAYENWNLFGDDVHGAGSTFDWSHNYGPIDWPRDGKTLLRVRSAREHYWKAETLDYFDGLRWVHSRATQNQDAQSEIPRVRDPRWDAQVHFRIDGLSSHLLIGAGTVLYVKGDALTAESGDGTVTMIDGDLQRGDAYDLFAYVPKPSPRRMRAAPREYPSQVGYYTTLELPARGASAARRGSPEPDPAHAIGSYVPGVPLGADPVSRSLIDASPYRRTYALARRLAAGAPTAYDVVRRIERHFERGFAYTEQPPTRPIPLDGFLFRDHAGYCQQFSGAMALMLRMNGIPARVAAGFTPGLRDRKTGEFRVRDYDAHSWVEVYFTGIGWVAFDPTPAQAPASSQESDARARRAGPTPGSADSAGGAKRPGAANLGGSGGGGAARSALWIALAALVVIPAALLGLLWAAALVRDRRVRRSGGDPDLRELVWALGRLGHPVREGTTLLELERRLAGLAGPAAARHVRSLRERRFAPPGAPWTGGLDRRALRRGLAHGRGPLARIRALVALPPAGRRHARG